MKKKFAEREKALREQGSADPYAAAELQADQYYESKGMDEWIDACRSSYLIDQAIDRDVETPAVSDDSEFWQFTEDHDHWYLNRKGRDLVQDLINKKKDQDSADWARWGKLWLPIITAFAALCGAATGVILALKK